MGKDKKAITNVMRLLDTARIPYETKEYDYDESDLSGVHAASVLGFDPDMVFKTLVLKGDKSGHFVCVIPVKELVPLTGYMRGGCSPIGMKKQFPTYIDETAQLQDVISVSAGQRGVQVILSPDALTAYIGASYADLI